MSNEESQGTNAATAGAGVPQHDETGGGGDNVCTMREAKDASPPLQGDTVKNLNLDMAAAQANASESVAPVAAAESSLGAPSAASSAVSSDGDGAKNTSTTKEVESTSRDERHATAWSRRISELKHYKEQHGDCNVPQSFAPNASLGLWVNNQRRYYRKRQLGERTPLSDERIAQLEELGFSWRANRSTSPMRLKGKHAEEKRRDRREESRQSNKVRKKRRMEELERIAAETSSPASAQAGPAAMAADASSDGPCNVPLLGSMLGSMGNIERNPALLRVVARMFRDQSDLFLAQAQALERIALNPTDPATWDLDSISRNSTDGGGDWRDRERWEDKIRRENVVTLAMKSYEGMKCLAHRLDKVEESVVQERGGVYTKDNRKAWAVDPASGRVVPRRKKKKHRNAFNLYLHMNYARLNKRISGHSAVMQEAAKEWKALTIDEKRPYEAQITRDLREKDPWELSDGEDEGPANGIAKDNSGATDQPAFGGESIRGNDSNADAPRDSARETVRIEDSLKSADSVSIRLEDKDEGLESSAEKHRSETECYSGDGPLKVKSCDGESNSGSSDDSSDDSSSVSSGDYDEDANHPSLS